MEYLDICDEKEQPTGGIVSRDQAHRDGIRHRTAHVWVIREEEGRIQILLQKRSANKESFPGMYDTSSAGHIPAGCEPLDSALRELREELGIAAREEQLCYIGAICSRYEAQFRGKTFRDNEYTSVYLYREPVDADKLRLQVEEVERVDWFDLEQVREEIAHSRDRFCVPRASLALLRSFLLTEQGR